LRRFFASVLVTVVSIRISLQNRASRASATSGNRRIHSRRIGAFVGQLRCDGSIVERWPVVTGDDPDLSDLRRAAALISHRATIHQDGLHWSLAEAAEAGRLVQLLRAVDFAYRVVIEHFGADTQTIDEQIQRFTTAAAADSFDVYNRHAARAMLAMRAEARAALHEVVDAVNRESAGPRLVGASVTGMPGFCPCDRLRKGRSFCRPGRHASPD
jgi:hypothetical protein